MGKFRILYLQHIKKHKAMANKIIKTYTVVLEQDGDNCKVTRTNEGFNIHELMGILEHERMDLYHKLCNAETVFKGTRRKREIEPEPTKIRLTSETLMGIPEKDYIIGPEGEALIIQEFIDNEQEDVPEKESLIGLTCWGAAKLIGPEGYEEETFGHIIMALFSHIYEISY